MQMTDFGSAASNLYQPSAASNWYPNQFIGNSFTGLNSSLNLADSPNHHQLNTLNQLHHHSSLDSATNAVLHNSPPNSTSPQQQNHHQQQSQNTGNQQLTNLSNSLPSFQTTQPNHTTTQLLSPAQTPSRSNTTSLNLSTNSNSKSMNNSNNNNNNLAYGNSNSAVTAAHLHSAAHQFNLPHSHHQFNPHSLATHHPHTLNHLTAHHHFLNVSNNFFPGHHLHATSNSAAGTSHLTAGPSAFTTPPSPSSPNPNNTSINSTTNAFNSLTFRPDSASNQVVASSSNSNAMNAVAAMAAMSRASGLSPTTENTVNQLNGNTTGYELMHHHSSYASYPLIDHHHSSRTSGLDSFVGLHRHMPTLTNLTNCNTNNNSLNNLDDSNVNSMNSMFIAHHHHNQSLNSTSLMSGHLNSANALVPLHGSTHNSSVNSSSDSRHNGDDELNLNCTIKQEDEDNKLNLVGNQFTNASSLEHHHPLAYNWVKKTQHNSQSQAGNKR